MIKFTTSLIALFTFLSIETFASNPQDVLLGDAYFWGNTYIYGQGATNHSAKHDFTDKVYITPDSKVYVLKADGKKHNLKGCRSGQSGVNEDGTPKIVQADNYSFIHFNTARDNIRVRFYGTYVEATTGDQDTFYERFYLHHSTIPGFLDRHPEFLLKDHNLIEDTTQE